MNSRVVTESLIMIHLQFVEVWQHAEDLAGQQLDAVLAEVSAKYERRERAF